MVATSRTLDPGLGAPVGPTQEGGGRGDMCTHGVRARVRLYGCDAGGIAINQTNRWACMCSTDDGDSQLTL